jgi:hypothetical protein
MSYCIYICDLLIFATLTDNFWCRLHQTNANTFCFSADLHVIIVTYYFLFPQMDRSHLVQEPNIRCSR